MARDDAEGHQKERMANQSEGQSIPTVGVSLGELIESTVNDLRKARANAGPDPVMKLTSCEMELAVTANAGAGGGVKFYIVDVNAKVDWTKVSTIKLTFGPTDQGLSVLPGS